MNLDEGEARVARAALDTSADQWLDVPARSRSLRNGAKRIRDTADLSHITTLQLNYLQTALEENAHAQEIGLPATVRESLLDKVLEEQIRRDTDNGT